MLLGGYYPHQPPWFSFGQCFYCWTTLLPIHFPQRCLGTFNPLIIKIYSYENFPRYKETDNIHCNMPHISKLTLRAILVPWISSPYEHPTFVPLPSHPGDQAVAGSPGSEVIETWFQVQDGRIRASHITSMSLLPYLQNGHENSWEDYCEN